MKKSTDENDINTEINDGNTVSNDADIETTELNNGSTNDNINDTSNENDINNNDNNGGRRRSSLLPKDKFNARQRESIPERIQAINEDMRLDTQRKKRKKQWLWFIQASSIIGPMLILFGYYISLPINGLELKKYAISDAIAYKKSIPIVLICQIIGSSLVIVVTLARQIQLEIAFQDMGKFTMCLRQVNYFNTIWNVMAQLGGVGLVVFDVNNFRTVHIFMAVGAFAGGNFFTITHSILCTLLRFYQSNAEDNKLTGSFCSIYIDAILYIITAFFTALGSTIYIIIIPVIGIEDRESGLYQFATIWEWIAATALLSHVMILCYSFRWDTPDDEIEKFFENRSLISLCFCFNLNKMNNNLDDKSREMVKLNKIKTTSNEMNSNSPSSLNN